MRPVPAPVGSALASKNNTKYLNIKVKKKKRHKLFQLLKQVSDFCIVTQLTFFRNLFTGTDLVVHVQQSIFEFLLFLGDLFFF